MSRSERKEQRINQLIEKLGDANPQDRCNAASELARYRDPRATEALGRVLTNVHEEDFVIRTAARTLASIGKEAVGALISGLKLYDRGIYAATYAAEALGEIGDIRAGEALLESLVWSCHERDIYVGEASLRALQRISGRRPPSDLIGLSVLMDDMGKDAFLSRIREILGLPQPQARNESP